MKIIIQRLAQSTVYQNNTELFKTGRGLLVYVGFHKNDKADDVNWISRKILSIYVWPTEDGKPWKQSVVDLNGDILLVIEPRIYASVDSTNEPILDNILEANKANELFGLLVENLKKSYQPERIFNVTTHEKCKIDFLNQGPVTFSLDSFHRRD